MHRILFSVSSLRNIHQTRVKLILHVILKNTVFDEYISLGWCPSSSIDKEPLQSNSVPSSTTVHKGELPSLQPDPKK